MPKHLYPKIRNAGNMKGAWIRLATRGKNQAKPLSTHHQASTTADGNAKLYSLFFPFQYPAPCSRILILDTTPLVRTGAPLAAEEAAAAGTTARLVPADTQAKQHEGDERSDKRAPDPAEAVGAQVGAAAGVVEGVAGADKGRGEEARGDGVEEQRDAGDDEGDGGAEAAAAGEEAREEGEHLEEEGDQDEDPAEAPHVEVVVRGGAAAVATAQVVGDVAGVGGPGPAQGEAGLGARAVLVVVAADVEVGPLRVGARAGDAVGVGAQEVRLVEGRRVGHAREDDEEEEEDGGGEHDEAAEAEGEVCGRRRDVVSW